MAVLRATKRGFSVVFTGDQPKKGVVDVFFDDHRVWSIPFRGARRRRLTPRATWKVRWPAPLLPYLTGQTQLQLRRADDASVIATRNVSFGGGDRVMVADTMGRHLAMNKWDRLGPVLDGASDTVDLLLADAVRLADLMEEWGYPLYLVGGTLLGALRSGTMLPHDDDIDFAWLSSKHTDVEVAAEGWELQRKLRAAGYHLVPLSQAHIQVTFFTEAGETSHYIDIFTGYHTEDGVYNQPMALRGELAATALVPASTVTINGVELPAPANPEAWLEFAYGRNWRIPDPSFVFRIPRGTRRRFDAYHGVYNRMRVIWEKFYEKQDVRPTELTGDEDVVDEFLSLVPPNSVVIDLGCGDGRLTERIAAAGHRVIGVDYSYEALRLARRTQPANVEYRYLNINDEHQAVVAALDLVRTGEAPYFFANRLMHGLVPRGREVLFQVLRGALLPGTFLYGTSFIDEVPWTRLDTESWRFTFRQISQNAARSGLAATALGFDTRTAGARTRQSVRYLIRK